MATKYEIRPDNPDPDNASEWGVFALDPNCHARRVGCTTSREEAEAMLLGLTSGRALLEAAQGLLGDEPRSCEAMTQIQVKPAHHRALWDAIRKATGK